MSESYEDYELEDGLDVDDEYEDAELEARLSELEYQFGVAEPDGPSELEVAATSQAIAELERLLGVELDDDEFNRVGGYFEELGDVEAAFALVQAESEEAEDGWQQGFDQQRIEVEKGLGRTLTESEVTKLWDAHEEVSEPDVAAKFKELWPEGKGDFDLDMSKGRDGYYAARQQGAGGSEPVKAPGLDSTSMDRAEYMDQRMSGAEVADDSASSDGAADLDTSTGRAEAMDQALADQS